MHNWYLLEAVWRQGQGAGLGRVLKLLKRKPEPLNPEPILRGCELPCRKWVLSPQRALPQYEILPLWYVRIYLEYLNAIGRWMIIVRIHWGKGIAVHEQ